MKATKIIEGTNHFVSFEEACRYYLPYEYDEYDIRYKMKRKEIVIGKPDVPGTITVNNGRYFVEN